MSSKIAIIIQFLKTDIWRIRLNAAPPGKSFIIKQARIFLLAFRGFDEDKCRLRASALTFYSLLSIVPILAMLFGIAKGFGLEKALERQLLEKMPGQEQVINRIIVFSHSLLENTRSGIIAGIGVAILFWTVIKVLSDIEYSFNDIWGVKRSRPLGRKICDYLSVMLICPLLIIISSSATVFIVAQITSLTQKIALLEMFNTAIFFALKWLPYCIIWILFTFLYIFMPNTKVKFTSALVAGIIAGTIYQIVQATYISFQIGVAKYNAIYGSFAALPLFLVWLQLSWLIILFGAEISFAHQNVDTYEFEPDCRDISRHYKNLLALQITHKLVHDFLKSSKPVTTDEITHSLEIPIRIVREILYELLESGIIVESKTSIEKETGYQPARPIEILTIKYVLDAIEHKGAADVPVKQTKCLKILSESLDNFGKLIKDSPYNKLLKDIVC